MEKIFKLLCVWNFNHDYFNIIIVSRGLCAKETVNGIFITKEALMAWQRERTGKMMMMVSKFSKGIWQKISIWVGRWFVALHLIWIIDFFVLVKIYSSFVFGWRYVSKSNQNLSYEDILSNFAILLESQIDLSFKTLSVWVYQFPKLVCNSLTICLLFAHMSYFIP